MKVDINKSADVSVSLGEVLEVQDLRDRIAELEQERDYWKSLALEYEDTAFRVIKKGNAQGGRVR